MFFVDALFDVSLTTFFEALSAYVTLEVAFLGFVVTTSFAVLPFLTVTFVTFLEPDLTVIVGFLTVILTFLDTPATFAVIVTLPALTAVTLPAELTFAIFLLEDLNVTFSSVPVTVALILAVLEALPV